MALTLTEMIMLKRAEEQVQEVLSRRWCPCGAPIKVMAVEKLCMRCRQMARRRAWRQREANRK